MKRKKGKNGCENKGKRKKGRTNHDRKGGSYQSDSERVENHLTKYQINQADDDLK